jgi:hypothetical protein
MYVKIKNLKTGRKFGASFETKQQAEQWVKNHKSKGKDEQIMFSPSKLEGAEVLGEQETAFGITYKLKFPAEYEVEYLNYDPNTVQANWEAFRAKRLEILKETDWTQLSDVPISTEKRMIYKKYREYVRNKKNDYKDENIHQWKILSFKEYKDMKFPK